MDPNTGNEKWNKDLVGQFQSLYGEKPTAITIMFPKADPHLFFAQWRKRYGSSGLRCKGDGANQFEVGEASCASEEWAKGLETLGTDDRGMIKVKCLGEDCPYSQSNDCKTTGTLQVLLPEIKGVGVWQITTGSFHSIVNINSAIEWLTMICGRYWMIPLKLMRVPQDIQDPEGGAKRKHYILQVDQNAFSLADIQKAALIDPERVMLEPAEEAPSDEGDRPTKTYRLIAEDKSFMKGQEWKPELQPVQEATKQIEAQGEAPAGAQDDPPEDLAHGTEDGDRGSTGNSEPNSDDPDRIPILENQKAAIEKMRKRLEWEPDHLDLAITVDLWPDREGLTLETLSMAEAGELIQYLNGKMSETNAKNGS